MVTSKSVSVMIANLKIAYPYYFKDLSDEEFIGFISLYQEHFGNCNVNVLALAIKKIIRKSKFMPSIADILEEYRKQSRDYFQEILKTAKIEDDERRYLISMVDWYSIQEEYPPNILNRLNEIDEKLLSGKKSDTKLLGG